MYTSSWSSNGRAIKFLVPRDGLSNGNTHIQVRVSYDIGGYGAFGSKPIERGYHLIVTPVKVDDVFVTVAAFSGFRTLLAPAKSFGAKAIEKLAEQVGTVVEEIATQFAGGNAQIVINLVKGI